LKKLPAATQIDGSPFSDRSNPRFVSSSATEALRKRAASLLDRAYTPFSNEPTAAVVVLDDGTWIPGVRVESASFSLTIPALVNAYTTAVAYGQQSRIRALALSRTLQRGEAAYVSDLSDHPWTALAPDIWVPGDDGSFPAPTDCFDPRLSRTGETPASGIRMAREAAERAHVPASNYPVGAVLELDDGPLLAGVNVEHPDWSRILCAERNAVGTAYSYREPSIRSLFLTCTNDPDGTPCGACRQILAELTPEATLWMDRHSDAPQRARPSDLLPGSFRGRALLS
jgi:homotetrameric cytidine deaminase